MTNSKRQIKIILTIVLLSIFLDCFYYVHESLPKPIRALTSLIEAPVALVSGLFYYLKIGINVYESSWAIALTNLVFSTIVVLFVYKILTKNGTERNT